MNEDYTPDGLTEPLIDALITEAFSQVEPMRRSTSPFAALEMDTRRERREMARRLRVLPTARPAAVVRAEAA